MHDDKTRHVRPPHLGPLSETTSHSTRLQTAAAKSLVIPQAGEGDKDSLREFHINQIEAEDAALFRAAIGAVKPLPKQNRITPQKPPRKALHRPRVSPPAIPDTLSDFTTGEAPEEFLSNGLSRMMLRKLRRGAWPIQDNLDLHGNNSDTSRRLLQEFLHEAAQHKLRCVLVIHGKGMNSRGGEAVLKMRVRHWLVQHPLVLAYCDALPGDGGSGAVLLLLKAGS